ncbi:hypothetical protein J7W19_12040 [Streptomyces mobaraensis NBRC 13819 = DSM 40847]|uniref:Uncharacterized protein n=1 Tax=Streptomyces mobaraensis (strain ATCC 29032 / DSM 40847 / JCM 4168 / NBRC 13819 / NCIMB 11159 / IPCR 16-22) TaxID=1223523 RepID=M3AVA4_STRM1|nr:hypothetical protein [Streptomyces mobaraensis]EME97522.1 hypothetical protein H340_26074 [Streptomyces mobaraensis NBRC 13819 = DSM 40847]QTT74046.1 hypothetical protein J7W19_12040 [Streptomyces mobaraensis NBRC 13819 = DSM 40847]
MKRIVRAAATVAAGAGAVLLVGGAGAAAAEGPGRGTVHVLVNGAFENRPGELVDIDVQGVRSGAAVTAHSPAFRGPVRLAPYGGRTPEAGQGHHARPAVAPSARPGAYPLTVRVGGRTVAEDLVRVRAPRPPLFQVADGGGALRPGERVGLWYDDLYPGERGTSFTVRSPVFPAPVRLVHDPRGSHWNNPRMFGASVTLPSGAKDGTYKLTLTGPGGRALREARLVVRAARPGDGDYVGRARGPAFFTVPGTPERARTDGQRVGAGGTVNVLWRDASPDPGEDGRLTATSPAFETPVPLRRDDSKAGDGDDPRYVGPARIRRALGPGAYPVTVVSHHGRVRKTGRLLVTGASTGTAPGNAAAGRPGGGVRAAASAADDRGVRAAEAGGSGASGVPVAVLAGAGGGVAGAAALGAVLVRRRRARAIG